MTNSIVAINQEIIIEDHRPGPVRFVSLDPHMITSEELARQLSGLARLAKSPAEIEMLVTVAVSFGVEVVSQ